MIIYYRIGSRNSTSIDWASGASGSSIAHYEHSEWAREGCCVLSICRFGCRGSATVVAQ